MQINAQPGWAVATVALGAIALVLGRPTDAPLPPDPPLVVAVQGAECSVAVIGDYGDAGPAEAAVAKQVASWDPDFIVTLGDNNYPRGAASTIDANIGQYYSRFIHPYRGAFGDGAAHNRFFPSLGNHDWRTHAAAPYLEYFELPGNERYYDVRWGPVHLFAIDSDRREPDSILADGTQAQWLRRSLEASDAPWKLVYMHHPPYSSGEHGGAEVMRWPFAQWGADAVLAGHDHHYERLERDGIVYFVMGVSGSPKQYAIREIDPASKVRVTDVWGAMAIDANAEAITLRFVGVDGVERDSVTLRQP